MERHKYDVLQGWITLETRYSLENGKIICRGYSKTFDRLGNVVFESEPKKLATAFYPENKNITKKDALTWGLDTQQ